MSAPEKERSSVTLDTIVSLCKRRGIIYPGSDIYDGLAGTYDYGPVGIELKRNVKEAWWRSVVYERGDCEGLDAAILMNPRVWKSSGHVDGFSDPLVDSYGPSRKRYRADHIEETECTRFTVTDVTDADAPVTHDTQLWAPSKGKAKEFYQAWWERELGLAGKRVKIEAVEGSTRKGMFGPDDGGLLSEARNFNLMLTTKVGPVEDAAATVYLRPETAQGIFVNFENVRTSARRKLPFGIAQMGKSFRNEITPKNFIFRTREFEQMEVEFFCKPGHMCKEGEMTDEQWHKDWLERRLSWYHRYGIRPENLRTRPHASDELAHYAKACYDIEYLFPIGWQELEGVANRTDFDLRAHSEGSSKDLRYFDQEANAHYFAYVIEPSAGADRSTLAFLVDAYREEEVKGEKRVSLKLNRKLAPIKAAVFPLLKNRPELVAMAENLCADLRKRVYTVYDDTAGIGKLYRRQDEIGTPYCVTVDVESLEDQKVTIRDRDTMEQVRIPATEAMKYITSGIDEA